MPNSSMAALDETAMSLKTQKPSPLSRKAWCVPPEWVQAHCLTHHTCTKASREGVPALSRPLQGSAKSRAFPHRLCLL